MESCALCLQPFTNSSHKYRKLLYSNQKTIRKTNSCSKEVTLLLLITHRNSTNTLQIIIHKISLLGRGINDKSSLNWFKSSNSTNELSTEFHKLIAEGRKEFEYVSVLAKGVMKCWLCPWVGVERVYM